MSAWAARRPRRAGAIADGGNGSKTKCANGGAIEHGFRLPAIIVSPYAKKGFVLKTPTEQASIPRLVEELWGMPFMTARDKVAHDGTAGSLMESFDFSQMPRDPLVLQTHACP